MTSQRINQYGQPVGDDVPGWQPRPFPDPGVLPGRVVRLEPLAERHVDGLFATVCAPGTDDRWTYMPAGPFPVLGAYRQYVHHLIGDPGVVPLAIVDQATGQPVGVATYLRIDPQVGSIEVGSIMYSPQLAGTVGATEAMYLMAAHAFDDLGYRRYEWKCDALNEPSRRAALRLGFTFEGVFRQATMYKGRNRDTAWFSITDADWPAVGGALRDWLDPANLHPDGAQRMSLAALRTDRYHAR